MKPTAFLFFFAVVITQWSCIRSVEKKREVVEGFDTKKDYFEHKVSAEYAQGFKVTYHGYYKTVEVFDARDQRLLETYLLIQRGAPLPEDAAGKTVVDIPLKTIACQSTTHLPLLLELGEEKTLTGFSATKFVRNEVFKKRIKNGHVKDISGTGDMDLEKVLDLNADIVMIYPFESRGFEKFKESGVTMVFNAEYTEYDPVAKAEWIKFMALFFNKEAEANQVFNEIKSEYKRLSKLASEVEERPTVFMNKGYQNTWHMGPGNGASAKFLKDAGANYLWENTTDNENLVYDFETVFDKAHDADFWVIITDAKKEYSRSDLVGEDERYPEFDAFKNDRVLLCNLQQTDYFGDAVLEPHIILADLIKAFHPALLPEHAPVYFKKLK
jgi:iron complex transport system substrate-binding protein